MIVFAAIDAEYISKMAKRELFKRKSIK